MLQKFDKIEILENNLLLHKKQKIYNLEIKNNFELLKLKFQELKNTAFSLEELKNLEIIDFDKIKVLKNHIDNMVFALYFKIKIQTSEIKSMKIVKKLCKKNKYYEYIFLN